MTWDICLEEDIWLHVLNHGVTETCLVGGSLEGWSTETTSYIGADICRNMLLLLFLLLLLLLILLLPNFHQLGPSGPSWS